MANWIMKTGVNLRALINSDDESESNCKLILEEILKEYLKIQLKLKLDADIFDLETESLEEDMEIESFDIDTVNCHLRAFYDICDELKVWIEM